MLACDSPLVWNNGKQLVVGQLVNRRGQTEKQLLTFGLLSGRRALGYKELLQPGGGIRDGAIEGLLQRQVALPGRGFANLVGNDVPQNLLKPFDQLGLRG